MASWDLVVNLVGRHLIPCLLASAVIYIALGMLFRVCRLLRPADRAAFLYIALLKAGLALWAGAKVSCLEPHSRMLGYLGFSLPNLVSDGKALELQDPSVVPPVSALAGPMLLGMAVAVALLLCYRWARIAPVYRAVHDGRRAERGEFPDTFRVFEGLAERACGGRRWLAQPALMIIRDPACLAFVMGLRSPVVVLSTGLVTRLGNHEVEAVLAHELAHIRRLDHVGRWFAAMLRDIMAWNPFALVWYNRLVAEQEMACDEYAVYLVGDAVAVAHGLVEVAAHSHLPPRLAAAPFLAWQSSGRRGAQRLGDRIEHLAQTGSAPREPSVRWVTAAAALLGAFLLTQPRVMVSLPNLGEVLKRLL